MRVAVDATFLGEHRGGDETFMRGLLDGLRRTRVPGDSLVVLLAAGVAVPAEVRDDPATTVVRLPARPGPWHFAVTLPRAVRALEPTPDVLVSVTHIPWGGRISRVPRVLVLGDLSFVHRPRDYPLLTRVRLRTLVPRHVDSARAVLVPSHATRDDVVRTYGVDPARVHVVPNRVHSPAPDRATRDGVRSALAARGVHGPYLLSLGNLHPRKNVPSLVRAFRAVRAGDPRLAGHRLVVAGARWFGGHAEQDAAGGDPAVVFLGRVTDAERAVLLDDADALAYVSLFEGFGLPPLEAMARGVPVLASATTSLPEVCGHAALLVAPTDPEALRTGVRRVLLDAALRARLRAAGPTRAAGYDAWRVGVAATAALRAVLDPPPPAVREGDDMTPRQTTPWQILRRDVRADLAAMRRLKGSPDGFAGTVDVLLLPGTCAMLVFRLAAACHRGGLRPVSRLLYFANVVVFGADLAPGATVGPGLALPHPTGMGWGSGFSCGRDVIMTGMVRFGTAAAEDDARSGQPTVGDEVVLLDGAKAMGPITIGDRAVVAANALVLDDVPPDVIVVGQPARVVRTRAERAARLRPA